MMMKAFVVCVFLVFTAVTSALHHTLFDAPVSNHGARVRLIVKTKKLLDSEVVIKEPSAIGGIKSALYQEYNAQGKMPLLLVNQGADESG